MYIDTESGEMISDFQLLDEWEQAIEFGYTDVNYADYRHNCLECNGGTLQEVDVMNETWYAVQVHRFDYDWSYGSFDYRTAYDLAMSYPSDLVRIAIITDGICTGHIPVKGRW